MGIFDNLVNKLPFSDADDEYEDEDLDNYEDEEEYDEPNTKVGFFPGRSKKNRVQDEDDEEYDDNPRRPQGRTSIKNNGNSSSGSGRSTQLSPIRNTRSSMPASTKMQVRVIKPSSFDQARQITDTLLAHRTVLLNLEGLDVATAQRIVDFASGSCYALHGNFMKISQYIIVITPEDVDIAGDITGGRPDAVAGMLAGAAAQGNMNGMNGMDGMNNNSAFMNNTMSMNMNAGY